MMKPADFHVGMKFYMSGQPWRCTDVGTRTICAIKLDHDHDTSWYDGPPYALNEHILDEYALAVCKLDVE